MVEKCLVATEEDLLIDLTFHGFSASLLKEFASRIVRPYFNGNMNEAIKSLMDKAINEEYIAAKALGAKGNG
jgi:hypothetical protein